MIINKILKTFLMFLLFLFLNCTPVIADSFPPKSAVDLSQCQKIIEVVSGVYVAVGYGPANSTLIEGDDGIIIVDTMENTQTAERVLAEFRKITKKPIKAIIYTHSHQDHAGGAKVFFRESKPEIYARANFKSDLLQANKIGKILKIRTDRQHGLILSPQKQRDIGRLVCNLVLKSDFGDGFLPPNRKFVEERLPLEIAGVKLELVAAPGETEDQLFVWLPDQKVLLCGDNYYKGFPNLYAIRGHYRSPSQWADSLDKMLAEEPEYLIPGHTLPVSGAENVKQLLTDYRDAVRYVLDRTLEGMNRGLTPDRLVETIKLPEYLAGKPYLKEINGTVPWTVRSIYEAYLGWFDGNPTNLFPLSPVEESQRIALLAGGEQALLTAARDAVRGGDYQWASQLADYCIALKFETQKAKALKVEALTALAGQQINYNARHYYLSVAKELREQIESENSVASQF